MFTDLPTLKERYEYICFRSPIHFDAVECQDPYILSIDEWREIFDSCSKRGAKLPTWELINSPALFNVFPGEQVPTFDEYKRTVLEKTLEYAKFLGCSKVHLILGDLSCKQNNPDELNPNSEKIVNLLYDSVHYLGEEKITCLIEPLSLKERENYYLRSYKLGYQIVQNCKHDNLRLLTDIYHLQRLEGNLSETIRKYMPLTGHVQVSQVPWRDNPFNTGEIDYRYILKILRDVYFGYIGLEFKCSTLTDLSWISSYTR